MKYCCALICSLLLINAARAESPAMPSSALMDYVQTPDESYSWKERRQGTVNGTKYVELTLTSQTWRDITWRHQLFIMYPNNLQQPAKSGLLFITGGSWKEEHAQPAQNEDLPREAALFAALAEQIQSPVAVLLQVPFQPLFGDKYEDEIIAYTFEKFMRTGDDRWPLLLPMVKAAVRALDAVQECAKQKWELELEEFTVTGASKRGWTTWLTGAVDPRVKGIAPMVIDMLNMSVQMDHQLATWGKYSEEIGDYTQLGLTDKMRTEPGRALESIVDPFSYREQLVEPKLIILGTNDAYWPLDALNNYWNELQGPKHILYVPNNGHGLRDVGRLTGSLVAFHEHVTDGAPLPNLQWNFAENECTGNVTLTVESDLPAKTVQAWIAQSPTKDFRPATWTSVECTAKNGSFQYELRRPPEGYVAMFGEAVYNGRALPYYFSTNVRIFPAAAKP